MLIGRFYRVRCAVNRLYNIDNKKVVQVLEVMVIGKAGSNESL